MILGNITTEYALDIYHKEDGYTLKEYKLHITKEHPKGAFHFIKENDFKDNTTLIEYISNYRLGPSCYINEIILNGNEYNLDKEILDELKKLQTHQKMNIRKILYDNN